MSTVTQEIFLDGSTAAAANLDRIGEHAAKPASAAQSVAGWDAYDVWRRLIKEARDRRSTQIPE